MPGKHPFIEPASLRVLQKAFEGVGADQFEQLRKATQIGWVDQVGRLGDSVQLDDLAAQIDRGLGLDRATMDKLAEAFAVTPQPQGHAGQVSKALEEALAPLSFNNASKALLDSLAASWAIDETARKLLGQKIRDAIGSGFTDAIPVDTRFALEEPPDLPTLAELYQQLPAERKQDLKANSAGGALAIGRYIDTLIEQDDKGPVFWLLLQVLLAMYLVHSSVVRAINTLEGELGPEVGDEDER